MRGLVLGASAFALLGGAAAHARSEFISNVPNGSVYGCTTCHIEVTGGEGWNDFGQDLLEAGGANPDANPDDQNDGYSGSPTWSDVCGFDSDGDGYDNGEELGDPDCVWTAGDDNPPGEITNPGDGDDFPGGDGTGGLCAAQGSGAGASGALLVLGLAEVLRRRRRAGLSYPRS